MSDTMKKVLMSLATGFFLLTSCRGANDYTIYPIPQNKQVLTEESSVTFDSNVTVVCDEAVDDVTRDRAVEVLTRSGLGYTFADAAADGPVLFLRVDESLNEDANHRFDHHRLTLRKENGKPVLTITGAHTNAVFFGLATAEQMFEQTSAKRMPQVEIDDWADQQMRGIVEGYYGYPYTTDVRVDLMEWGKRYKMNTFIYGPKSEPYHLGYWKDDYPTSVSATDAANGLITQDDLRRLSSVSSSTKVDLVWAAHPAMSNAIDLKTDQGTLKGTADLLRKFDHLYSLGVRQFGIFLDDISTSDGIRDRERHALLLRSVQDSLEARYNRPGVEPADTVRPLNFVPTPYALNFASNEDLTSYFSAISTIQKYIRVYFTGSGVWSNISESDYRKMKGYLGRPVAMWWNFPCNDNNDRNIYLMDVDSYYKTDSSLQSSLGIVCNPMAQGEASKVTLFGVMDYCWNVKAFNSKQNWQHAFNAVVADEEMAAAFKAFAPYAMQNEPESLGTLINNWKKSASASNTKKLRSALEDIRSSCATLRGLETSSEGSDNRLYTEIRFWINKLHEMCDLSLAFLNLSNVEDEEEQWNAYLPLLSRYQELLRSNEYTVVQREGAGFSFNTSSGIVTPSNKYLMPFVKDLKESILSVSMPRDGQVMVSNVTLPNNSIYSGSAANLTDGDYSTYLWMSSYQANGDCYTITLREPTSVYDVRVVLMSGDRMTEAEVQISSNKSSWTTIGTVTPDELTRSGNLDAYYKDIKADGTAARYVRLRLSKADTSKWFKLAEIEINKHSSAKFVAAKDYSGKAIPALYDNDLSTSFTPILGTVTYYFNTALMQSRQAIVYQDFRKMEGVAEDRLPQVAISEDGKTWLDAGRLARGVQHIDLSPLGDKPYAMRLSFNVFAKPMLHEIIESTESWTDTSVRAVVETPSTLGAQITNEGLLVISSLPMAAVGIYSPDGAEISTAQPRAKECLLPLPETGTWIVRVVCEDGSQNAAKVTIL